MRTPKRNRCKELIEAFGLERGAYLALNLSVESFVHYGKRAQQRWLNEIREAHVPHTVLADILRDPIRYSGILPDEPVRPMAPVIELTAERRHRVLHGPFHRQGA